MKKIIFAAIMLTGFQASAQVFNHYYKDFVGDYEITECTVSKADTFCGMKKLSFKIEQQPDIGLEYVLFDVSGNPADPDLIQSLVIAAYGFPGVDCGLSYGSSNCSGPGADVLTKFTKGNEDQYFLEGKVSYTPDRTKNYSYRLVLKRVQKTGSSLR